MSTHETPPAGKTSPRIVLFHATPVSMDPVAEAMRRLWANAEAVNLLDDGLSLDRAREGDELSQTMIDRFVRLGRYAHREMGADGVLVACSAFGPAVEAMVADLPVPVTKPNEAMFRDALAVGQRIGMLATFGPSIASMETEFHDFAADAGSRARLETVLVAGAIDSLRGGDAATHNRLVAEAAQTLAERCDAIMLAHFSTSRAASAVRAVVQVPVFTAPDAAVMRLQKMLEDRLLDPAVR